MQPIDTINISDLFKRIDKEKVLVKTTDEYIAVNIKKGIWGEEITGALRECRGITYDAKTGLVVSRPFHKFFNLNEVGETQYQNLKNKKIKFYDKIDGSMIAISKHGNKLLIKSKMSEYSDVAKDCRLYLIDTGLYDKILSRIEDDVTVLFEYVTPVQPIVIRYPERKLTYLACRNNRCGTYLDVRGIKFANDLNIDVVKDFDMTLDEAIEYINGRTDIEGLVGRCNLGMTSDVLWFKLKTEWYCDVHGAITFLRYRDVARCILNGSIDDLISIVARSGLNIKPILDMERQIKNDIKIMSEYPMFLYKGNEHLSFKELSEMFKDRNDHYYIMAIARGKTIDWYKEYMKRYLNSFSLDVMYLGDA